jgi:orotate phosphoribosyltransferase
VFDPQCIDVTPQDPKTELLELLTEKSVRHGKFTLASGRESDLYVDAKLTTTDPRGAILLGRVGSEVLEETAVALNVKVDSIGGLTLGADALASSIGIFTHLKDPTSRLQTFIVRKSAKSHGLQKLIEGNFSPGHSVVVLDDVITTGGSTLQAIEEIQKAGGRIAFVIVLVDRQEGGREKIEARGHAVVPIFTRADLFGANATRRSDSAAA